MFEETGSVSYVVVLVVFGERQDVVAEKSRLLWVGEHQLCCQIDRLQLDYVTLLGERGGRKVERGGRKRERGEREEEGNERAD